MKKFSTLLLLAALFVGVLPATKAQTRPRRVVETTQTDRNDQDDSYPAPTTPSRPPVLGGTNNTNGNARPATTQSSNNEPVEVGDGDTVRVDTALVTIPVTVMDRDGKFIPNLRKEDFRIFEENQEQRVAYFASVETPFTVALVIDTSGSTKLVLGEIQDAAIAFVEQLRPNDRVMVVSFDDKVRVLAEATNDRMELRDAIRRTEPGEGTRLYDAVDLVMNEKLRRIQGRKAIVLFTDGVDTTSKRASYQTTIRDAEEADALIYPVAYNTYGDMNGGVYGGGSGRYPQSTGSVVGDILIGILGGGGGGGGGGGRSRRGSSRDEYERADSYLNELARRTGARLERADDTENMRRAFAIIAEELRRQYSLGYYPQSVATDGERRQIRVRVNRPNLVVRARDSYIAANQPNQNGQRQARSWP